MAVVGKGMPSSYVRVLWVEKNCAKYVVFKIYNSVTVGFLESGNDFKLKTLSTRAV